MRQHLPTSHHRRRESSAEALFRHTRQHLLTWNMVVVFVVVAILSVSTYIFLSTSFDAEINDTLIHAGTTITDNISLASPIDDSTRFIPDSLVGKSTKAASKTPKDTLSAATPNDNAGKDKTPKPTESASGCNRGSGATPTCTPTPDSVASPTHVPGPPTKKPEPTEAGKPPTHTPRSDPQANPRPTSGQPTVSSAWSVPQTTAPIADTPQTTTPIAQITTATQTVAATSPTVSNAGFPLDPTLPSNAVTDTPLAPTATAVAEQIAGPVLIPQTRATHPDAPPARLHVSGLVGNDSLYTYAEPQAANVRDISYQIFTLDPTTEQQDALIYVSNDQGRIAIDPARIQAALSTLNSQPVAQSQAVITAQGAIFETESDGIALRILPIVARIPAAHHAAIADTRLILVTHILEFHRQQLGILMTCTLIVGLFGLLLAGIGGWTLTRRAMIPIYQAFTRQRLFVADASHEFRTPLAIIRANAEIALRHRDRSVESQAALIGDIIAEADYLNHMVADLLLLAQSDMGQIPLQATTVNLSEIITDLHRQVSPLAEERGLLCAIDPPEVLILVTGDAMRLRQLLLILLDNAMKYTAPGGAFGLRILLPHNDGAWADGDEFDVSGAQWPSHHVGQAIAGPAVTLSIFDTGAGIPVAHLDHIFDRFYRVDKARARDAGSLGLGLAIARWIVDAHHAMLAVRSAAGKGSVFDVSLPLAPAFEDAEVRRDSVAVMPADA